jgi:hypothetical protein
VECLLTTLCCRPGFTRHIFASYPFIGCDVVLPIRTLVPPLPNPATNDVRLSATTRVEIKFDNGLQQWCVTSSTSGAGLLSARSATASSTLGLPVDGGAFLLQLKTEQGIFKNLSWLCQRLAGTGDFHLGPKP